MNNRMKRLMVILLVFTSIFTSTASADLPIGVDLVFNKITSSGVLVPKASDFAVGDTLRGYVITTVNTDYTVKTYVTLTLPNGDLSYGYYDGSAFIPDSSHFHLSDTKVPLYEGTWQTITKVWLWNVYEFTEGETGFYRWDFWYEDSITGEVLGKNSAEYSFYANRPLSDKLTGTVIHHDEWGYKNYDDYKEKIKSFDVVRDESWWNGLEGSNLDEDGWKSLDDNADLCKSNPENEVCIPGWYYKWPRYESDNEEYAPESFCDGKKQYISGYDQLVSLYQDPDSPDLLLLLSIVNNNIAPIEEITPKIYSDYVSHVVERYDGDGYKDMPGLINPVKYFEIGNEVDLKGSEDHGIRHGYMAAENYVKNRLIPGYLAAKKANPNSIVMGAGLGMHPMPPDETKGFSIEYLKEMNDIILKHNNEEYGNPTAYNSYMDRVAIHHYTGAPNPEQLDKDIKSFRNFEIVKDKPIWITEIGMLGIGGNGNWYEVSEEEHAGLLTRTLAIAYSNNVEMTMPYQITENYYIKDSCQDGMATFAETKLITEKNTISKFLNGLQLAKIEIQSDNPNSLYPSFDPDDPNDPANENDPGYIYKIVFCDPDISERCVSILWYTKVDGTGHVHIPDMPDKFFSKEYKDKYIFEHLDLSNKYVELYDVWGNKFTDYSISNNKLTVNNIGERPIYIVENLLGEPIANAIVVDKNAWISTSSTGDSQAMHIFNSPVGFLSATDGDKFLILSSGIAENIPGNPDDFESTDLPPGGYSGDTASVTLNFIVPTDANKLKFDFRFMSEEFPEYVGSAFNDFFRAYLTDSTGTYQISFDTNGEIINVNNNFFEPAITPAGTVFDGTTPKLTTTTDVTPGEAISLKFELGDAGDGIYDTAVFLDNIRFESEGDGGTSSKADVSVTQHGPTSVEKGTQMTYTINYYNIEEGKADNVIVTDDLPSQATFVSAPGGIYESTTNSVSWNLGTLQKFSGGSLSLTISVPSIITPGTTLSNSASISTTSSESDTLNNNWVWTTAVTDSSILPPNVDIEPLISNYKGVPKIDLNTPMTFTYHGDSTVCGVGINIHLNDGNPDIIETMSNIPGTNDWMFTKTFSPRFGFGTVTYTVNYCDESSEIIDYNILIDPSGWVEDKFTGERIEGAIVTLNRFDTTLQQFVFVEPSDLGIDPHINPQTSDEYGGYGWFVSPGIYRVEVEKVGYYSEYSDVNIPPAVTDLAIKLEPIDVPSNSPPVAVDDIITTDEDTPVTFNVTTNDSDADGNLDPSSATALSNPSHGNIVNDGDGMFTYTPAAEYDGADSFTYEICDTDGLCDTATATINVNPVNDPPVASVDITEQTVQYSDGISTVTISASDIDSPLTLTTSWKMNDGAEQTGLPDDLTLSSGSCTTTDPSTACTWTLGGKTNVTAGNYNITFNVSDGQYGIIKHTNLIVISEDSMIAFDDSNPVAVKVAAPGGESEAFSLKVNIKEVIPDISDALALSGDINLAEVSISLVPVGPGPSVNPASCSRTVAGTGYDATLTLDCGFNDVNVNTYEVMVTVNGGYYIGSGENVLVVYDPSLGFTTGGGTFLWPETGEKTNFGYNMKYNKKGAKVQGSLLLVRHLSDGTIYRVKSNALYGLSIGEDDTYGWASFSGKATYREPEWLEPVGNHEFIVYVEDHDDPGNGADRFWIKVKGQDGIPIDAMSLNDPSIDNTISLSGGNIVVPHK